MDTITGAKTTLSKAIGRPGPRVLTVKDAWRLTPNMIRAKFAGSELQDFPTGREGANCKLLLPEQGETHAAFGDA